MNLPLVSEEHKRNLCLVKNFSDENFTDVSGKEYMFGQGRDKLYRSLSDGEVINSETRHESGEIWGFLNNAKELDDEHSSKNINRSVEQQTRTSSNTEASDGESSWVVLRETDFLSNRNISKTPPESVEWAEINPNHNEQQSLAEPEERGKMRDETLLIVLDDDDQKDVGISSKENQQDKRNSSISLEESGGDVDKRATFYIGSRPNSGKLDQGNNNRDHSQGNKNGDKGNEKQGKGVEEEKAGPQQTQCDFYDDIEVIPDEPSNGNETTNVESNRFSEGETSPCYDQKKSVTKQSVEYGNTCLISGCDESSLLLPIVSEQLTLPQPVRMEKPVAIRAQPFTDLWPFESFSGLTEHKNDVKIDFNERIGSGGSRYNCGEKLCNQDNMEINLISLSSSSESNCSDCDSKTKQLSKKINELEPSTALWEEEHFMACQCPKQYDKKQLIDETDSLLYTVKSQSDLSIIVSEETKGLKSQEVKNEDSSETTTPPLLITIETDPQTTDVDYEEMKSDFKMTTPNPERSESSHTPTSASPTQHYESSAIDHAVKTNLSDENVHLSISTRILKEASSSKDDETVTDAASSRDIELGKHLGKTVREQLPRDVLSISDGVDPDLIHFFTPEVISPSPPMSAVSEGTNTDVDNEVADIMNTESDDYVIEFKSESSNDWTISSTESEAGNILVPVRFEDDKVTFVESCQDTSTPPEPFQAYPPKEFLIDIFQDSENIYNNGFNLEGSKELIQSDDRTIEVHNDHKNTCPSKVRKEPCGTDEQSNEDESEVLISISPFKTSVDKENCRPENINQGGDGIINEPSVQVFIDQSVDQNQYNDIDPQENVPTNFDDPTNECEKFINGNSINSRISLEDISNSDFQPLERSTDSETLLEKLPSVPNEPPCSDFRKEDSSFDKEEGFGRNVDSSPNVYDDVVGLNIKDNDGAGSVTYPELDMFAKARLRQGGLHHWEMNCLLTELSREQGENERLARDSKRAMEEFVQVKKEVENILSKFGSQICVEMF